MRSCRALDPGVHWRGGLRGADGLLEGGCRLVGAFVRHCPGIEQFLGNGQDSGKIGPGEPESLMQSLDFAELDLGQPPGCH